MCVGDVEMRIDPERRRAEAAAIFAVGIEEETIIEVPAKAIGSGVWWSGYSSPLVSIGDLLSGHACVWTGRSKRTCRASGT
jgi:hypothetical protein